MPQRGSAPQHELYGELWAKLATIINGISVAIADRAIVPDLEDDEAYEPEDWDSPEAEEYLEGIEASNRRDKPVHIWDVLEFASDEGYSPDEAEHELRTALRVMNESIRQRDLEAARNALDDLHAACESAGVAFDEALDDADDVLVLLQVKTPVLLYLPPRPAIYIPQLIIESNENLIRQLARQPERLYEVTPRKFEEIIADVFWKAGYEVELTKQTRDGGRDIIAISRRLDIPLRLLIECKRYGHHNKVSLALVQRLFGVKIAEAANKAILATTSTFTRDARVFASSHLWDLDLKDHEAVVRWLKAYPNVTA